MSTPLDVSPPAAEVFWRPGCPYCTMLRRDLSRRGIDATWRNIWEDDEARHYVRSVNRGNETVPTVRVGERTLTNPSGGQVAVLLGLPEARPRRTSAGRRGLFAALRRGRREAVDPAGK